MIIFAVSEMFYVLRYLMIYCCFTALSLLVLSCDNTIQNSDSEQFNSTSQSIPQLPTSNYESKSLSLSTNNPILNKWFVFLNLEQQITQLITSPNPTKDIDRDNLISLFEETQNTIPQQLNQNSILARLKVLETQCLKHLDVFDHSTNSLTSEAIFKTYQDLIFQINVELEKESQNIVKPF